VVIVAERLRSDPVADLQSNIQYIANSAYRLWREKGYPPERIKYLATDLNIDATGDGQSDVSGLANKETLQQAIIEWTKDKGLGPDRAFTLYLVDHGGPNGRFYLDNPLQKWVNSDKLNQWLTELEQLAPGVRINIIIEACYSGGFVRVANNRLATAWRTISKPGRVVIASTEAVALAYASPKDAWFSDTLIDSLSENLSLAEAYEEARLVAQQQNPAQLAWLDGNGNGIPNEVADYAMAAQRGFAISGSFVDKETWPPFIKTATITKIAGQSAQIVAEVRDDTTSNNELRVYAVIYPPSYQAPTESEVMVAGPVPIALISAGNNQYRIEYSSLSENGTYHLLIYAQDNDNLQAHPRELTLTIGGAKTYLPLIVK